MKSERGSMTARFIQGISWNVLAALISQGSVLIGTVIAARLLGKVSFGEWSIVQSTVITAGSIASAGMGVVSSKYVSEYRDSDKVKTGRIISSCLAMSVAAGLIYASLLFVLAPWVSEQWLHAPGLSRIIRVASVYVLFWSVWWGQTGILSGFEAFSKLARTNVYTAVCAMLVNFALTWQYGLIGAAAGISVSSLVTFALFHRAIRLECHSRGISISFKGISRESALLYRTALPTAISGVTAAAAVWGSNAMLTYRVNGMAEMAQFNASNVLRNLILFVPALIGRVASPMLSQLKGTKDVRQYRAMLRIQFKVTVLIALCAAAVVSIGAKWLLGAFGGDFGTGHTVLLILSLSAVLETIGVGLYQSLFANGKWWTGLIVSGGWSLVLVLSFYSYGEDYGAVGLAWCYVAAWCYSVAAYAITALRVEKQNAAIERFVADKEARHGG